jgi:plastocyanin
MNRNLSLASAILALLAALISAVACEREAQDTSPAQGASPKVATIAIRDYKFEPETVTVHEGDAVEWKNADNVPHTATADGQAQKPAFDSGSISTGAGWRYVAATKGTYNYICTFHTYMKGQLIVQ